MIMQEKNDTASKSVKRKSTKEERQFHVDSWKKSGLSMSDYCRRNNVPVANLSEWKKSLSRSSTQFKPIKSLTTKEAELISGSIVEILVDQRIKIRLQYVTDASLVINIAKGMLTCS
jgi:transposase-like protein